jgi:cell division protein FtsI/penicillin-binding protein 2
MLGRTDRRLRLVVLLVAFVVMASAAVVRLSYWQLARGAELRTEALSFIERTTEDAPLRGDILDRNGVVLATTSYRYLLSASPPAIKASQAVSRTVEILADILDLERPGRDELVAQLESDDPYVVVRRRLTDAQTQAVREASAAEDPAKRLVGVALEPRAERFYPNPGGAPGTTLASHLLGFVNEAGDGTYGVEQFYDELLAGQPTRMAALHDLAGQALFSSARVLQEGSDGRDISLTIDASLQLSLEKELYSTWVADRAARVSGVVLDPDTGAVLAWASVPGYDANDYARIASSSPDSFIDPIATDIFEPGSVMKMLTAAAALDAGVVTLDQKVADGVSLTFGPDSVHNFDGRTEGRMRFRDAIAFSRNVATARVAGRLDRTLQRSATRLYDMWSDLGIGQPTGIDLANEGVGLAPDPQETTWWPIDLANRAFGQGVAVTQAQLAVAYTAMVNGGERVTPYLLAEVDGEARAASEPVQVLRPRLASDLEGLLEYVTQHVPWYREGTQIDGYTVGGKTATAQIWDPVRNAWKANEFNFSFVGFVGAQRPEAVIAVRIQEAVPRFLAYGNLQLNIASYEAFRRIAQVTVADLEIPPLPPEPPADDIEPGHRDRRSTDDDRATQPDPGG